jgi:hypothetical protein
MPRRLVENAPTTQFQSAVLSTANAPANPCNRFETSQINIEEISVPWHIKALTEKGVRSIVKKVPRGLRNSKPPET